ncbi:unnamed protein product [Coffea canephora]|uniref:Uncharacterized protein n=1 Tax=Coffea canephora TaxID=49390 RepID=A0A068UZC7_COFCA|nr:unnamed protein product [Coffea canephora]
MHLFGCSWTCERCKTTEILKAQSISSVDFSRWLWQC